MESSYIRKTYIHTYIPADFRLLQCVSESDVGDGVVVRKRIRVRRRSGEGDGEKFLDHFKFEWPCRGAEGHPETALTS